MPIKVKLDDEEHGIKPKTTWSYQYLKGAKSKLMINSNFYVASFRNMN
jgi:hypothetical protein